MVLLGMVLRQTQIYIFSFFRVLRGETIKVQVHHTFISNTTHSTFTQLALLLFSSPNFILFWLFLVRQALLR